MLEGAELTFNDGHIAAVEERGDNGEGLDGWVVPGYVDTHCHGALDVDFGSEDKGKVLRAIGFHRAHGSTTLIASTVTAGMDQLLQEVARLRPLVEEGELAGLHLEGPFLASSMRGAHNPEQLRDPSPAWLDALLGQGGNVVRMVTLAPELPGGLDAVRSLVAHGVIPAIGHTAATPERTREAVRAGARIATHVLNGMPPMHHRHPGPAAVLLSDASVTVELIADGVHIDVDMLRLVFAAATADRISLVTDAMSATGCADGRYALGSLEVTVSSGVARLVLADGTLGSIAGSTLTMHAAFVRMVREVGVSVPEAARMASTTPARAHGLADVGVLERGRRADLCWLDSDLRLRGVMRHGNWIHTELEA